MSLDEKKANICVGLDFGTTFSGLAYHIFLDQQKIGPIDILSPEANNPRIPSKIHLDSSGNLVPAGIAQGSFHLIEWFKYSLLHRDELSREVKAYHEFRRSEEVRESLNKSAIEIVGLYLKTLWDSAQVQIRAELKERKYSTQFKRLTVIATVPAVWPKTAIMRMREAMTYAGFLSHEEAQLEIIPEPEAAAIYLLVQNTHFAKLEPGEKVLVVDCGGATVDVISYEISQLRPLRLAKCTAGRSILSGGGCLDEHFRQGLKQKVAQCTAPTPVVLTDQTLDQLCRQYWHRAIKGSNENKLEQQDICVPMPSGNLQMVTLTKDDLHEIFDPVIRMILSLIEDQVVSVTRKTGGTPHRVIVCGGLGSNSYLQRQIEDYVSSVSKEIKVTCFRGETGECAVARGASYAPWVAFENTDSVNPFAGMLSRISKAEYGLRCDEPDSYFWFLSMGGLIPVANPTRMKLNVGMFRVDPGTPAGYLLHLDIYRRREAHEVPHLLCMITWKPEQQLVLHLSTFVIELEISHTGTLMKFSIYRQGIQEKNVTVNYD